MAIALQILLYLFIGFIEMFLATARTKLISRGKTIAASSVVFIENIIYFLIIYQLVKGMQDGWPIFVAYSMGGSLGTFINLKKFA
jgi:uncharacterized protein YebE (UPF0316 family)